MPVSHMKPAAPRFPVPKDDVRTLHSEVRALCEGPGRAMSEHADLAAGPASDARVTVPAPPDSETLRLATPLPAPPGENAPGDPHDTEPSPPPSSRRLADLAPTTIPGPPPLPRIPR